MVPSTLTGLMGILSIATSALAQNPPISTSNTFVLYPYITSGNLTGPYTNSAIDRSQPLRPSSGRESGTWTTDCFNRFVFTSYVATHCASGTDQCGYQRWSLNATYPSASSYPSDDDVDGQTLVGYISNLSSMLIDTSTGDVGWTSSDCGNEPKTPGFGMSDDGGILHLAWEDQMFFTCWVDGDLYGPRLFAKEEQAATPEGCADVLLVPRCVNETSLVQKPVGTRCYLGGLPA